MAAATRDGMRSLPHECSDSTGTPIHSMSLVVVCAPYTNVSSTKSHTAGARKRCASHGNVGTKRRRDGATPW